MTVSRPGAAVDVTVVLPCLNERDAVGLCVAQAIDAMKKAGLDNEVVVVDNGSTDGSAEVAAAAGARVIHEQRRGYGRALRTGFEQARGEVVVMADADGTYDLALIPEITRPVLAGETDLVLATRLDGATSETMPFLHRYVGTPVITFLTSRAGGRKLTRDSQTGYRAFRRDQMLGLGLAGTGMELASEMLINKAAERSQGKGGNCSMVIVKLVKAMAEGAGGFASSHTRASASTTSKAATAPGSGNRSSTPGPTDGAT